MSKCSKFFKFLFCVENVIVNHITRGLVLFYFIFVHAERITRRAKGDLKYSEFDSFVFGRAYAFLKIAFQRRMPNRLQTDNVGLHAHLRAGIC